ncbi:peptidoglycan DD-metalloendopeptidase family protein [Listeria booriae]|uniref:lysozyme family protein n=1 Tax=Listeria booriae TaxID=1552123 RepID=UPI0016248FAF|nr:lysozyme family protein [Listeria booriae]MBC1284863.1 peptidoglycan DD-metalloendopeptidase family protein [Listeria booriae]
MKKILVIALCLLGLMFVPLSAILLMAGDEDVKSGIESGEETGLSQVAPEVERYRPLFEKYAVKYQLEKYVDIIMALVMQESGGRYPDVMQSSESIGLPPNTITDPEYSIDMGMAHFKNVLTKAKGDVDLTLQSYNYGGGFIDYVNAGRGGKYTLQLAHEFSVYQAQKLGWPSYGDPEYVPHVRRYLVSSNNSGSFIIPVDNPIVSSGFGIRWGTLHKGLDFAEPIGTAVKASKAGKVEVAFFGITGSGFGGYGNVIMINHLNGEWTLYAHLSRIDTKVGAVVNQGTKIGETGNTGDSTGPHLHFEIRKESGGAQIDPAPSLGIKNTGG